MLPALMLGILLVVGVLWFLGRYSRATTEEVKKQLRITGLVIGIVIIVVLAATGRLAAAFAFVMGLGAWATRVFSMVQMGKQFTGMFKGAARKFSGGSNESEVKSAFFAMNLEHGTGNLDGKVLQGAFAGRRLSSLALSELITLYNECRGDPDSAALLEAFLDRNHPDWRGGGAGEAGKPPATKGDVMTKDEASRILGVAADAPEDEIKAAYRRLMGQLHPDKGGSDYLAAKVNAAKEALLARGKTGKSA